MTYSTPKLTTLKWSGNDSSSLFVGKDNDTSHTNDTSWVSLLETTTIYRIQLYAVPFLVAFGGVGNLLSLWVFCTPAFKGHSSSCYLAALATSDTLFLLALFVVWASNTAVDVYNAQGWCQGITYLTHVTTFVSVWLVVAFTVERFIAVCYPLLRSVVCTVRRARIIVTSLFVTSLFLYSYLLLAAAVQPTPPDGTLRCTLREGYETLASVMNTVDTVLTLVLPVIAILTLNTRIAKCVYYIDSLNKEFSEGGTTPPRRFVSRRRRGNERRESGLAGEKNVLCGANSATSKTRKPQHNVTKMLLVISTIFILLNLPSYAMRLYMYFTSLYEVQMQTPSLTLYTLEQTFILLFYSNFAVNFLLYCVTGQNFRRAVVALCKEGSNRQQPMHTRASTMTTSRQRQAISMSPEVSRLRRLSQNNRPTAASIVLMEYSEGTGPSSNNLRKSSCLKKPSVVTTVLERREDDPDVAPQSSNEGNHTNTAEGSKKLLELTKSEE